MKFWKSSRFWYGMTVVFVVRLLDVIWPTKPSPWWAYAVLSLIFFGLSMWTDEL
jgi:hypothetical protein